MQIKIVTEAWHPQINGVVRTLTRTKQELEKLGHEVTIIEPSMFKQFKNPIYKEIPFVFGIYDKKKYIKKPCAVHIATEGTLGLAFNRYCRLHRIPFTTSYHTNFPDYLNRYIGLPKSIPYWYLKWFHKASKAVMVATPTLSKKLHEHGFKRMVRWSRGVDTNLFKPGVKLARARPICTYVGRVSKEKNIEAFLESKLDIEKVVVGNGPHLEYLKAKYPGTRFMGTLENETLAGIYQQSDCFVFPSKSDTFGLVLLEALACGVPIAAYPVEGPIDIWNKSNSTGFLHETDLDIAIRMALSFGESQKCVELAKKYSWENCTRQFFSNLAFYS